MDSSKFNYNPVLPKPDKIYEREFHFMEHTLLQREQKRARKLQRKQAKEDIKESLNEVLISAETPHETDDFEKKN